AKHAATCFQASSTVAASGWISAGASAESWASVAFSLLMAALRAVAESPAAISGVICAFRSFTFDFTSPQKAPPPVLEPVAGVVLVAGAGVVPLAGGALAVEEPDDELPHAQHRTSPTAAQPIDAM